MVVRAACPRICSPMNMLMFNIHEHSNSHVNDELANVNNQCTCVRARLLTGECPRGLWGSKLSRYVIATNNLYRHYRYLLTYLQLAEPLRLGPSCSPGPFDGYPKGGYPTNKQSTGTGGDEEKRPWSLWRGSILRRVRCFTSFDPRVAGSRGITPGLVQQV